MRAKKNATGGPSLQVDRASMTLPSEPSLLGSTLGPKFILHQPCPYWLLERMQNFWIKIQKTLEFACYIPCEIKWKCKFAWNMWIHTLPELFKIKNVYFKLAENKCKFPTLNCHRRAKTWSILIKIAHIYYLLHAWCNEGQNFIFPTNFFFTLTSLHF